MWNLRHEIWDGLPPQSGYGLLEIDVSRGLLACDCHSERSEESLPGHCSRGGMLRLRRSSAQLHSGSAQHDTTWGRHR